jgi:nucleoside-diphosphate-sugar epimerase
MARIALTGASGFVGRHLVSQLSHAGYQLRIATRKPSIQQNGNIQEFWIDLIESDLGHVAEFLAGCDTLIHLAGEINDEARMRPLNVGATSKLAQASEINGLYHWIHLSSCGVYGKPQHNIVTEDCAKQPRGLYETTKWEAEQIIQNWGLKGKRKVTILRPSVIWSGDMPNNALRSLIHMVKRGLFFYIGPQGALYPLVHVDDVSRAALMSLNHKKSGTFIFNLSDHIPLEQLMAVIADISNCKQPHWRLPEGLVRSLAGFAALLPGFPLTQDRISAMTTRVRYSSDFAAAELGWKPMVDLRKGLTELIQTMKAQS